MTQAFHLNHAPSHLTIVNHPSSQSQAAISLSHTHCLALQSVDGVSHLGRMVCRRVGVWVECRGRQKKRCTRCYDMTVFFLGG